MTPSPKLTRRTLLLLTLSAGCSGGGGGVSTPTGVILALDWPDASRVLPVAAKSVRVQIKLGTKILAERLYLAGPDSEEQINELPFAEALVLEASAFSTADATGATLATASVPFNLFRGKQERLALTLTSVISRVALNQATTGLETTLMAVARDGAGSAVLTLPEQWQWSVSDPTLGTLTPAGSTASFTELGFGVATLTATEKESGKAASVTRPVCSGDPSKTAPLVATVPISVKLTGLVPLENGSIVLSDDRDIKAVDNTGATLWRRTLTRTVEYLQRMGDYVVVSLISGGIRVHRISDGAFFWEDAILELPSLTDSTSRFFGLTHTSAPRQLHVQARGLTTGDFLWDQAVPDNTMTLWADSARLLCQNQANESYFAFHATLGYSLWESRVPSGSQFLGVRLTGATPLLFSLAPGELRALFLTTGVRTWGVAVPGDQGYLTPDKNQLIAYSETQCSAYAPATGTALWSRSGLTRVIGMLPNGDLLVLPPTELPGCQPIQALRPTDGSVRWSTYLPSTTVPKDSFIARIAGSRIYVSLTGMGGQGTTPLFVLDSTTGQYLWGTRQYGPGATFPSALTASGNTLILAAESNTKLILLRDS
ncbi:PQQ-binding-like beta-propeller repeat protein [Armatimonas sp.]|uniref:outer membrane protein assembly factor BamB family protein n=1 Tax=Armatimonas sp. TaxID=1872638 RepID=UPI00286B3365|nr:PQQ-binding-like beta-propeller repeat protein [Armatimonas sp.]